MFLLHSPVDRHLGCFSILAIINSAAVNTDAFILWCWRRLLRVLWIARKSSQSVLKEINLDYSLEGLLLKLNLHTWPPDVKNWLTRKGWLWGRSKTKGKWHGQRMRWLDSITDSMDMNLNKLQQILEDRRAWHATVHRIEKRWTWLSDWTMSTMNIELHIAFQISVFIFFFLDVYPGVQLLDHVIVIFLVSWGISILFPIVVTPIYIPTNSKERGAWGATVHGVTKGQTW